MAIRYLSKAPVLLGVMISLAACGDEGGSAPADGPPTTSTAPGDPTPLPDGVFESVHPSGDNAVITVRGSDGTVTMSPVSPGANAGPGGVGGDPDSANEGTIGQPGSTPPAAQPTDDLAAPPMEAARAIEEADVIKRSGDRLYALSSYGGLSVIDVSNPDALELLGRYRSTATPFEMYVRDEVVFVLYNGYGQYEHDAATDSWTFYQTSYVIALDTSNPQQITEAERFEISGYISDSRLIGDVLYVVAFDDTYCYRCGNRPETNVMSLDVSDPNDIDQVDELSFEERLDEYGWRRSLSATDERLYIAGPRYGNGAEPEGSIIQVVDVSDRSGEMLPGDSIEVAGQINSRWQMDEYDGTLRVISQPLWWQSGTPPEVETFQIESSESLVPLATLPLVLPRPETLQAVRFDGPRGYAITFEQIDPLFTIDLSDPENPVQAGELEMPGWVYYMEPRGDRVIGLGFDQGNPEGSLTVSIFDVSELSTPTMVSRVNFGGDWAQLAEDQDRIHKSFQVLDDHELILVPFSGHVWDQSNNECGRTSTYTSGVQLIDWSDDALTLRGIAPSKGQARRSFFIEDRLLTMSDERLESFDIENRDAPKAKSRLDLAQIVNQVATLGDTVVRFGESWWSETTEISVSSLDELLAFESGASLSFDDLNRYDCTSESWLSNIMSGGDNVYLMYRHYDWSSDKNEQLKVRTLDVSDPADPRVAGDGDLGFLPSYGRSYIPGMVDNGVPALVLDDALVFAEHGVEYNNLGFIVKNDYTLVVVDMSKPDAPKRRSIAMPDSLGSTGLLSSDNVVATSHFETSPTNPNSVRFYLDRVDVSDPESPELLPAVNVPGSLLAYDHEHGRALTLDYQYVTINDISPQQCYEEEYGTFVTPDPSVVDYVSARGPCAALRFTLHLVEIDGDTASLVGSYDVDKGVRITTAAIGEDRVFLGTGAASGYYHGAGPGIAMPEPARPASVGSSAPGGGFYIGYASYPVATSEARLLVASGLAGGKLTVASTLLETTNSWNGFSGLVAKGDKAVVATGWQGHLSVIDASDAEEPVVRDSVELAGYVRDLDIAGDVAIAAMGTAGVQTIPLGD